MFETPLGMVKSKSAIDISIYSQYFQASLAYTPSLFIIISTFSDKSVRKECDLFGHMFTRIKNEVEAALIGN